MAEMACLLSPFVGLRVLDSQQSIRLQNSKPLAARLRRDNNLKSESMIEPKDIIAENYRHHFFQDASEIH
jgi:hypothetical protein